MGNFLSKYNYSTLVSPLYIYGTDHFTGTRQFYIPIFNLQESVERKMRNQRSYGYTVYRTHSWSPYDPITEKKGSCVSSSI